MCPRPPLPPECCVYTVGPLYLLDLFKGKLFAKQYSEHVQLFSMVPPLTYFSLKMLLVSPAVSSVGSCLYATCVRLSIWMCLMNVSQVSELNTVHTLPLGHFIHENEDQNGVDFKSVKD